MSQATSSSPAVPETVYVDPLTGLYHTSDDGAGPDPARYSRPQADLVGYDPCPTCFSPGGLGGDER